MRFNTLADWLSWQETLHPREIDLGLDRVGRVYRALRGESLACPVVTVAGTNGKGSSVALLEAIYHAAGYRVGAYTSPHLLRYNERIRIDGTPVDDGALLQAFTRVDDAREATSLSYFEFGTLAALELFHEAALDVAVLEVGLGGRLDAVNIVDADVALITAIGIDHVEWLGSDRDSIGREKAGIMRKGRPVVCSDPSPPHSIAERASEIGATLYQLGREFDFRLADDTWSWRAGSQHRTALPLPALRGEHQLRNAAGALMVVELLAQRLPVAQQARRAGLLSLQLPGRFQVVPGNVTRIFDVAHNADSVCALAQNLARHACTGRTHAVVGMLADKDAEAALTGIASQIDVWHVADLPGNRGGAGQRLSTVVTRCAARAPCTVYANVGAAYRSALGQAMSGDRVVVFGSFRTVEAALNDSL